jgi:hypothetical protein
VIEYICSPPIHLAAKKKKRKETYRQIKGEYEPSQNIDNVRKGTKKRAGEKYGIPIKQLSLETQVG